ncbi:MAG: hypothetical protein KDD58_04040 [Bdellovibrionales bacterium]|nr:hypothetical protein [Bdellovibrionales bacterium]
MKVIRFHEILSFFFLVSIAILSSFFTLKLLESYFSVTTKLDFINVSIFIFTFMTYTFAIYNFILWRLPLPTGLIPNQKRLNWIYHLHTLYFLLFFQPLIISNICPVPFRRKFYQLLGAKLGFNSYPAGIILDPQFVEIGDYCIIGFNSLICPHILTVGNIAHEKVNIGNNVTISVGVTIYGGTTIENGAKVLPHAVVNPHTYIKAGEVWGGIPARKIKESSEVIAS